MKFSSNWLREWMDTSTSVKTWSEKLTTAGLEVEAILSLGENLEQVYIGQIVSVRIHPNADRLKICEVCMDYNAPPITIVCGAVNVRTLLKVAVAKVGACLPGNLKIKRSRIRGVESNGMICSAPELGLWGGIEKHILELPEDAPIGIPLLDLPNLRDIYPDALLDVNLTPNRGDCLSIAGLARELSAIGNWPFIPHEPKMIPHKITDTLSVYLDAPDACSRYVGCVIKRLSTHTVTPDWMQARLHFHHMRCIHPVVDIMNYVMLELGQPLHAFDFSTIESSIHVRYSKPDETVQLLTDHTFICDTPVLVIADQKEILALAGIMGGKTSAVSASTNSIFIESAFFAPAAIRPALRKYHLESDAAYRFERGVDPDLTSRAMYRAVELVLSICGGEAGPIIETQHVVSHPSSRKIILRAARISRILGISLSHKTIFTLLSRLNLKAEIIPEGWCITAPTYRFDLQTEIDLIEEIARLHGYDAIPPQTTSGSLVIHPIPATQSFSLQVKQYLITRGYYETIHYSFTQPAFNTACDPKHPYLALVNPISSDLSVMRTTLWPGLLQSALFNLNRQQSTVRLFEIGNCFWSEENNQNKTEDIKDMIHTHLFLAGIVMGEAHPIQWDASKRQVDFFDVKGDLENLFMLRTGKCSNNNVQFKFVSETHPALHPHRCAAIYYNEKRIGYLGELHPTLQKKWGLSAPAYLFEFNLSDLESVKKSIQTCLLKYHPVIQRDLAFILHNKTTYAEIKKCVIACGGNKLQSVELFDVYKGENISQDHQSLALHCIFQCATQTLTDKEVDLTVQKIIMQLRENFQAVLRSE